MNAIQYFFLFVLAYILVVLLTPLVFVINLVRKLILKHDIKEYIRTAAIGFDQAGGSILYNQENFTVSSYTYHLCAHENNRWACFFEKFINFFFGKDHCKESYEHEVLEDKQEWQEFAEVSDGA